MVEGPRLVPGGVGLDTTGDYNDTGKYWWRLGNLGAQRFCDGPDEFRKAVRQEIKRGVEIIKIFASGGHGVAEDSQTRGFAHDELRAILDAAHDRGRTRARALRLARPDPRVRARGRRHHRPRRRDRRRLHRRRWCEHGTFLCPALYFVKLLLEYAGEVQIATPAQIEMVRREFDNACRMIPKAQRGRRPPARSATTTGSWRCRTAAMRTSSSST